MAEEENGTAASEETPEDAGTLENVNIEDEMARDYIDYSMSVIVGRALPDVRDGLKPVHRRCLYAMHMLNNTWNSKHLKSARIVGDVIGKYHPHGDSAVYETIVRMAQDFSLRCPLVDGHGNFGSIDGDGAAAMRYTEVRMQKVTEEMLGDLEKDTVDMVPNYDETTREPSVLPAKLPNLLLNGSSGIAVGMATNIPPHNLAELCDGITHYVDHPDCTIDDLMEFVKGPDFPTGAQICGHNGISAMYKLGRGQIRVRGKATIETEKNGRERIIITEIPYAVNKREMIIHMADLVKDKVIEGISDIRDESKSDVRIVVELKRDAQGLLQVLHRPPLRGHHAPHALRSEEGRSPQAHPRRSPDRHREPRRGGAHHPRLEEPRRGQDRARRPLRLHGASGERHPRDAPLPAHRTGTREARGGTRRTAREDRRPPGHPRRPGARVRHHQGRPRLHQGEVRQPRRGAPPHGDRPGRERSAAATA